MIKFRLSTHSTTSEPMVEVWRDDTFVASIYGHEEGVRLVSKYFDGVEYDPDSPPGRSDESSWLGKANLIKQEEEMTTDFNLLRHRLETERKSLMERLKTNVRPAGEKHEGSPYGKVEEAATEYFELEKSLALEKHTRELLAEVEHALHKFELGTYGLCERCGQPIESSRLEALPQANLCLSCKAAECQRR